MAAKTVRYVPSIGDRFGKLVIIEYLGSIDKSRNTFVRCRCDCGNEKVVGFYKLRSGGTKACGCMQGKAREGFKLLHKRLFSIWRTMMHRCYNTARSEYKRYGGRGIFVCEEWRSDFKCFCNWAYQNGYQDSLTLDRRDNDGGYSPENCRWATNKVQQNNKSNNVYITYMGVRLPVQEWSRITGIKGYTLIRRYRSGWELSRVFSEAKNINLNN